jgi:hypothetical protein
MLGGVGTVYLEFVAVVSKPLGCLMLEFNHVKFWQARPMGMDTPTSALPKHSFAGGSPGANLFLPPSTHVVIPPFFLGSTLLLLQIPQS